MKHLIFSQSGEKHCFVNAVYLHLSQGLEFPTASPSARQVLIDITAILLKLIGQFWNEIFVGVRICDNATREKSVKMGTKGG